LVDADAELVRKLESLEKKYDAQFKVVFDATLDDNTTGRGRVA